MTMQSIAGAAVATLCNTDREGGARGISKNDFLVCNRPWLSRCCLIISGLALLYTHGEVDVAIRAADSSSRVDGSLLCSLISIVKLVTWHVGGPLFA